MTHVDVVDTCAPQYRPLSRPAILFSQYDSSLGICLEFSFMVLVRSRVRVDIGV